MLQRPLTSLVDIIDLEYIVAHEYLNEMSG